jgi:aminoglycoside phosphotransferase (APT) family kinase protein
MPKTNPDFEPVAAALSDAFPEAGVARGVGLLGEGFHSLAIETASGYVIRVGQIEGAGERYTREQRLLAELRRHLPLPVPRPDRVVVRSPSLPFGASCYRKLPGRELSPELLLGADRDALARQLGLFLAALHAAPTDALDLVTPRDMQEHYGELRKAVSPALVDRLSAPQYRRIDIWWDTFLNDREVFSFVPAASHQDFWYGNILVDQGGISGVVDWEFACAADPAMDIATLLHLGNDFTARVVRAYRAAGGQLGTAEAHRAGLLWEVREFYGVRDSLRLADERELLDAIRKLAEGPLFDRKKAFLLA